MSSPIERQGGDHGLGRLTGQATGERTPVGRFACVGDRLLVTRDGRPCDGRIASARRAFGLLGQEVTACGRGFLRPRNAQVAKYPEFEK